MQEQRASREATSARRAQRKGMQKSKKNNKLIGTHGSIGHNTKVGMRLVEMKKQRLNATRNSYRNVMTYCIQVL